MNKKVTPEAIELLKTFRHMGYSYRQCRESIKDELGIEVTVGRLCQIMKGLNGKN